MNKRNPSKNGFIKQPMQNTLERNMEFYKQIKGQIKQSENDIIKGKTISMEELKKKLKI